MADPTTPQPISDRRIQTFCLVVLTIIALAVTMWLLRPVLVPFTLALFGAIVMSPLVNWLVVNARIPKWMALLVAMMIGILLFLALGAIVTSSIAGLTANREAYRQRIIYLGESLSESVDRIAGPWLEKYAQPLESVPLAPLPDLPGEVSRTGARGAVLHAGSSVPLESPSHAAAATVFGGVVGAAGTEPKARFDFSRLTGQLSSEIASVVQNGLLDLGSAIVGLVSEGVLVLIFLFFLMAGDLTNTERATGFWGEVETRVKNYLVMKVAVSSMTGIGTATVLALLGVDLAMTFGVLAFALNFIPNVGSAIAMFLPLPIVILSPDATIWWIVLAIALPGAVQLCVGNVIEPKLMGDSLDLHPVLIMMALIFFGMIWGIVGMLLATPIAAIIKIVLDKLDVTRPMAELMAGRMIDPNNPNAPPVATAKVPLAERLFGAAAARGARRGKKVRPQKMKRFGQRG